MAAAIEHATYCSGDVLPVIAKDAFIVTAQTPGDRAALADALDETVNVLCRYVHFADPQQSVAVALWCAATYRYSEWGIFPRLTIRAPTRGSGKTRLLEVVSKLASHAWGPVVGPTAAAFFRKVHATHPTVLLDEVDQIFAGHSEDIAAVVAIINSGHTKGQTVPRVDLKSKKADKVEEFDVFTPLALAGIATSWPDTLLDRSIIVVMERRAPDEPLDRFRYEDRPIPGAIGERLGALVKEAELVRVPDGTLPGSFGDRALDNWEPLIAVAQAAGQEWLERAVETAKVLNATAVAVMAADERIEYQCLRDVVQVFMDEGQQIVGGMVGSQSLVDKLLLMDSRPWADYDKGRALTTSQLARLLRTFSLEAKRNNSARHRSYLWNDIAPKWRRADIERPARAA